MPERPYRLRELHDHAVRSRQLPPDLARAFRLHPDWPLCTAGCGWPVDPAGGGPVHPRCDQTTAATDAAGPSTALRAAFEERRS